MTTSRQINMPRNTFTQIADTYALMARMKYRPGAPSDGLGNITVPIQELDIEQEVIDYAEAWRQEEDSDQYFLGCPSFEDRPALILIVEAARLLNGQDRAKAVQLLTAATQDIATRTKPTATVAGPEAVAQIVAMQAQRITRMEASLRRIESMLEQSDPKHSRKDG
ncbi:hypothetical protein [Brevibacterium casei]|uniref:hypothetical protein n=1 Tax=Brevibacterium casei TaxID=33889 RepID=UPI0036F64A41